MLGLPKLLILGNLNAQTKLGLMYQNGEGVVQDYKKAYLWLSIAALREQNKTINDLSDLAASYLTQEVLEHVQKEVKLLHGEIETNMLETFSYYP